MNTLKSNLRVYFAGIKMNLYSGMQYKGWPLMFLQVIVVVITDPISVILLFSRFGNIGEWSVERVMLLYSMSIFAFGFAEVFFRGFDCFPWSMIQNGDFDRFMLYPKSLYTSIASSRFHIHRLARVFTSLGVIIWLLIIQDVKFDFLKTAVFILGILGATVTYMAVFVFSSGIAFFTIKGLDWIYIFTNASFQVSRCPPEYIPKALRAVFTFLMPLLVGIYYPASYACGWGEPFYKAILALPAAGCFFFMSTRIWKIGVRHYKSTGS